MNSNSLVNGGNNLASDPNYSGCTSDGNMCKAFPFIAALTVLFVTTGTFNAFT